MMPQDLFSRWLAEIASLTGRHSRDPQTVPNEYLTIFPVKDAVAAGVSESLLMDFLIRAFRAYCRVAASAAITGWFYAWFDEMSGTLRCSVAVVRESNELPFSCRFETSDDPRAVSRAALRSSYLEGIPVTELEAVPWTAPDAAVNPLVLSIYAKPTINSR